MCSFSPRYTWIYIITKSSLWGLASQEYKTWNIPKENLNKNFEIRDPKVSLYYAVTKKRFY